MNRRICDLCGDPWPKHRIKLTHRPNDEDIVAELCEQCVEDIRWNPLPSLGVGE